MRELGYWYDFNTIYFSLWVVAYSAVALKRFREEHKKRPPGPKFLLPPRHDEEPSEYLPPRPKQVEPPPVMKSELPPVERVFTRSRWQHTLDDDDNELGPYCKRVLEALRSDSAIDGLRNDLSKCAHIDAPGRRTNANSELCLLYALVSMELFALDDAQAVLDLVPSHTHKRLVEARLALWRNESPGYTHALTNDELWQAVARDNNAQVDIDRGERPDSHDVFPVTAACAKATYGDAAGAIEILARLDPARRDALLRAFPEDAATIAWLSRDRGPYR